MSFIAIKTALTTIVGNVSTTLYAKIFNHDPGFTDSAGFPYIAVISKGATEQHLDTGSNQTLYTFVLRAVDVGKDKATTETTVQTLADAILAELRKRGNITLGGIADRLLPFRVSFKWDNNGQTPFRYCEIEIDVLVSHNI